MVDNMKTKKIEGQVTLTQMLKALDKDVASGIEKKLKKLSKKKAIKVPLDKNKAEKIERIAAYSSVSKDISKWEPIVDQHRNSKHVTFPLDHQPDILPSTAEALGELKPRNSLEHEVQNVIKSSSSALHDNQEFSKAEERYLKAISAEEAQERHTELQRMRVLLSSYAAKMRRQKAIKSKSYHRLLKQERLKRHMKKVESSKDMIVEEIDRLQRLRAKERASLKHKNTGKWAKHAKFRAKYDDEARKAMLEQIGLAEKLLERPMDDDDDSSDSEDEVIVTEESSDTDDDLPTKDSQLSVPQSERNDMLVVSKELAVGDEEEDDEQRKLMSEAFADDDVVTEFKKAKDQVADEEQPKDVDKFLPGWGGWAGPGIKISKKKRSKFIVKAKKLPRKDDNLGNVIISEKANDKMKTLMVNKLPHGMKNDAQLIKLLTEPTTSTFVDQATHRKAVRPRIETKLGARIEPMSQKVLQGKKAKWA